MSEACSLRLVIFFAIMPIMYYFFFKEETPLKKFKFVAVLSVLSLAFAAAAFAADYGVIDVQKIFNESAPGKAAAAHMQEVQKILQKGMDDVLAMHKGQENTPQAQQAIAEAQQLLNRQLAVEQQATNAVMERELREAVSAWLKTNKKTKMILSKQLTLGNTGDIDFTTGVMKEMNKRKPTFPALPKVTINRPAPAPAPASGEVKK